MNTDHVIVELAGRPQPGEAELAAVAFLARYNGRTLEAYQHDLRDFFGWAESHGLAVLHASRADIEMYRHHMEQRALAASTIDRRLSTVCGYYRYAHIDGRIPTNPAQYVRRPSMHPTRRRAWTPHTAGDRQRQPTGEGAVGAPHGPNHRPRHR